MVYANWPVYILFVAYAGEHESNRLPTFEAALPMHSPHTGHHLRQFRSDLYHPEHAGIAVFVCT